MKSMLIAKHLYIELRFGLIMSLMGNIVHVISMYSNRQNKGSEERSHCRFSVSHHSPMTPLDVGNTSLKVLITCSLSLSASKSVYWRNGYDLLFSISSFGDILLSLVPLSSSFLNNSCASGPSLLTITVASLSFRSPKNFTSLGLVPTKVRNITRARKENGIPSFPWDL